MDAFAGGLADVIDKYVKTATVSTTVNGACVVAGVAGTIAGTGAGTVA